MCGEIWEIDREGGSEGEWSFEGMKILENLVKMVIVMKLDGFDLYKGS